VSETHFILIEPARSFTDGVNRADCQQQAFLLLRNGVPFAQLIW